MYCNRFNPLYLIRRSPVSVCATHCGTWVNHCKQCQKHPFSYSSVAYPLPQIPQSLMLQEQRVWQYSLRSFWSWTRDLTQQLWRTEPKVEAVSAQVSSVSSQLPIKLIKRICSNIITLIYFSTAYLTDCMDASTIHLYESSGSLQLSHSPSKGQV